MGSVCGGGGAGAIGSGQGENERDAASRCSSRTRYRLIKTLPAPPLPRPPLTHLMMRRMRSEVDTPSVRFVSLKRPRALTKPYTSSAVRRQWLCGGSGGGSGGLRASGGGVQEVWKSGAEGQGEGAGQARSPASRPLPDACLPACPSSSYSPSFPPRFHPRDQRHSLARSPLCPVASA